MKIGKGHVQVFPLIFIYFWLCWVFIATLGFSLDTERKYHSFVVHGLLIVVLSLVLEHRIWGVWASVVVMHGLSSWGSRAPGHRLWSCGTWVGLVVLKHVGSSWTRDQTSVPSIARWILNHRTTREVQSPDLTNPWWVLNMEQALVFVLYETSVI